MTTADSNRAHHQTLPMGTHSEGVNDNIKLSYALPVESGICICRLSDLWIRKLHEWQSNDNHMMQPNAVAQGGSCKLVLACYLCLHVGVHITNGIR